MKSKLPEAYWIGGVTRAGETTIAHRLADEFSLRVYSLDEHFDRHARQSTESAQPTMYAYQNDLPPMTQSHPVPQKVNLWNRFHTERFPMVVSEVAGDPSVIAEGVGLLPDLVAEVAEIRHAAWMVPTRDFWLERHLQRGWARVDDWDYYQARIVHYRARCSVLGFRLIVIDGTRSVEDVVAELKEVFELWSRPSHSSK